MRKKAATLGTEGAILSEYAVVVGVCGIVMSIAIFLLGAPIVSSYRLSRQTLIAPIP